MRKAVKISVTGLVQGVFFRASLSEVARSARVSGWVRNRIDGSVEALIEGEEEDLKKVLEWARRGPPRARVDSVRVEECRVRNLRGFKVTG